MAPMDREEVEPLSDRVEDSQFGVADCADGDERGVGDPTGVSKGPQIGNDALTWLKGQFVVVG
jgi:hypothetical protein